ncbi:MAG TPA: 2Fe-2S iron-sulfur cluster-binding protein [Solirubrobacteraceae bacterium]|nr:2Fe-2S iron-sulfur cluster-binding protein [Solirubrobacteraceae bacterium]
MTPDPAEHAWWLASRSAGVVALLCITISVGVGLAMAGRVAPAQARLLLDVHQWTALAGLVAIAVHGITLLGDAFLDPGLAGIVVPFLIDHAPLWTGLGVTAGWLGAILGLSYWARDRVGPRLWRRLHKATVLVYVLSVAHTLGAGTDASAPWMRVLLLVTGAPILFLFLLRVLPRPSGFRRLRVAAVTPESSDVTSFALEPRRGRRLPRFEPGQSVAVRIAGLSRSYSLSAAGGHRISVKRDGAVSGVLHAALRAGDTLEVGAPQGRFVLDRDAVRPVVLLSTGIGATPVLAMLHALAEERSAREVWWIHGARSGREHAFAGEVRALLERLPNARSHIAYSRPEPGDTGHDAVGRIDLATLERLGVPLDAAFHLCGSTGFVRDLQQGLRSRGATHLRSEAFGGPVLTRSAEPAAASSQGPAVTFSRSGVEAPWGGGSLLELAEASGVQARSGCRVGSCHHCRTPVLAGAVRHDPEPLEPPPPGAALLCCALPEGDVVLDA